MSALATHMIEKKMDALDIPPIDEFIDEDDFVGEFYEQAAGGQIIFT